MSVCLRLGLSPQVQNCPAATLWTILMLCLVCACLRLHCPVWLLRPHLSASALSVHCLHYLVTICVLCHILLVLSLCYPVCVYIVRMPFHFLFILTTCATVSTMSSATHVPITDLTVDEFGDVNISKLWVAQPNPGRAVEVCRGL